VNILLWLGIALVALWLVAWLALKVFGLAVHLILFAAAGLIVYALARRTWRRVAGPPRD
jgi:hypothetical protein